VAYSTVRIVLALAKVYLVSCQPDRTRSEKHQPDDCDPELIVFHSISSFTLRIYAAPFPASYADIDQCLSRFSELARLPGMPGIA
jgi:hypothetical protein